MRILDNSRQIPKDKNYIANSNYCDYLYGYLQAMSSWDGIVGHPRYVFKKSINYSRIANDLGKSRQTISKKFKQMIDGDIENNMKPLIRLSQDGDKYELIYLEGNLAMLVPQTTLQVLVSTLNENSISLYVYLLNRYLANASREYQFSYPELKNAIGIGNKSHGNNSTISSILFILKKIGLLDYRERKMITENGLVKSEHYITWMTNEIEGLPSDIEDQSKDKKRWDLYKKMTGKERTEAAC